MMICIGGVCVPLNLLIPFLIGVLHRYGYLQWFKQEWVTLSYWRKCYTRWTTPAAQEAKEQNKPLSQEEELQDKALQADKAAVHQAVDSTIKQRSKS